MKFSNILAATFGLFTFAAALPAPAALGDTGLDVLEKRSLIERAPASFDLTERGATVDLVADVQVCIDAVVEINKKYTAKKSYTSGSCKAWAVEVIAKIQILIDVITAYPKDCTYPSIDVCVNIFVQLFVCIFVQLKVFLDVGGLIAGLLLTVDLLLAFLLGLVGDLLNIIVSLCLLIEVKIKVGICGLILSGCQGLLSGLYINVLVKLLVQAGISL
ncbi:hypothetical protein TWF694_005392 [Orbilia ellipsospora]|uniref:Uncharacterized protein n=1 Tax=Orbilia ellipsospora TaxID=2528407 RepID=A0AAV9WSY9_9PEZI